MSKLGIKLQDEELAAALTAAGLDNPRKVRDATDKDIEKAVGKGKVARVRAKLPKDK